MLAGQLTLIAAALFAGAAVYINVAEQPARLDLGDGALLTEWKSAYERGFAMQAPLVLVGFLLGLLAWWQTKDWRWPLGAVVLAANRPYTFFAIMPTNSQLRAINSASAGSTSRMLVENWGRLHAVRSALGFVATLVFLWASMSSAYSKFTNCTTPSQTKWRVLAVLGRDGRHQSGVRGRIRLAVLQILSG
jgi:hypothetical protein